MEGVRSSFGIKAFAWKARMEHLHESDIGIRLHGEDHDSSPAHDNVGCAWTKSNWPTPFCMGQ